MYLHFAYIFDEPQERETDVGLVVGKAVEMDCQVRYWWLSDAMHLQGSPDRLIVCVRHFNVGVDTGMDLYQALKEAGSNWDELELASPDEWAFLGQRIDSHQEVRYPTSIQPLFGPGGIESPEPSREHPAH